MRMEPIEENDTNKRPQKRGSIIGKKKQKEILGLGLMICDVKNGFKNYSWD